MLTLRFDRPWGDYTSPLILRFNDGDPVDPPTPLPAPTLAIECGIVWEAPSEQQLEIALVEPAKDVEIQAPMVWQTEISADIELPSAWANHDSLAVESHTPWQLFDEYRNDFSSNWVLPQFHATNLAISVRAPLLHESNAALNWLSKLAEAIHTGIAWQDGPLHQADTQLSYAGHKVDNRIAIMWGFPLPRWICTSQYRPPTSPITLRFSEPFSSNTSPLVLRLIASPEVCEWYPGGGLIDGPAVLPPLDFKVPITPQVRRSYIMQPQLSCIRVSDGLAIVLKSVSISQSRSQWASSGSVTFSSRIDAQRAVNELLKISINGYDFFMWCEMPTESKSFGVSRYSATGRGRLAELSAPYIKAANYMNSTARSFMGLMGDIMANTGWTLASEITDFNVPANAFSYAGKTPAEAINMMANAIGAMLDIDSETKTITVIPQWPTVPWDMTGAVPDLIVHDGVILEFTEKREIRPDANAVFVRGEQQGVAVKVKRSGSAGDNFAEDVVDKIITDVQAARMRGTAELANAGNKVSTSIRTKLMADLPPMRPGMLVGVQKGTEVFKSVCDSSSITASVNGSNGAVSVNQSATLLRNEVAA